MGRDAETRNRTVGAADGFAAELLSKGIRVKVDKREKESPGFKYNYWELRGACVRVEIGPRDLDAGTCIVARRDSGEKATVALNAVVETCSNLLSEIQSGLFKKAQAFQDANTHRIDTWEEFQKAFEGAGGGGFVLAHWDGTAETEEAINDATKATIRCIPLTPLHPDDAHPGVCVFSGKPSTQRVVFAKAY
jgi:prolyl-tRNA synthetase